MKQLLKYCVMALLVGTTLPVAGARTFTDAPRGSHPRLQRQFFHLCSRAVAAITARRLRGPFFVDSYAVRALNVAYDMTGNRSYLNSCRQWCTRMVNYQKRMIPSGAYFMNYNRKPGQRHGDWYVADSSSIAMALAATAMRCHGPLRGRLLSSVEHFASLVRKHFIRPSGGVSDGLWSQSHQSWWCSSALFGSLSFVLYADTGKKRYLHTGLRVVTWLNRQDLRRQRYFPLSQQGPAMIMYVMECYAAGWPYIRQVPSLAAPASRKVKWCLHWILRQQKIPLARRRWPVDKGWGMKFGGLPFHEFVFSHYLSTAEAHRLRAAADREMRRLYAVVQKNHDQWSQLSAFLMMSYAERLDAGAVYGNGNAQSSFRTGH